MILQTISQILPTVVFYDSKVVLLTLCTYQVTATEDSGGFSTSVDVSEWKILVEWLWYRKDGEKAFSYIQHFKTEIDEI